ncbi:hypothetical protein C0584_02240 [Candidatus Parcubacteria bacterium]|nr:MAG: hypothetical protein C0584_02240 [Candidatus Parcubacteria bacterium]
MAHKIIFQKFEKGGAHFKDKDSRRIVLPENYVEKTLKEGDVLHINISQNDDTAKEILNELLDTEN